MHTLSRLYRHACTSHDGTRTSPAAAKAALINASKSLAQSRVGMRKERRAAPSQKLHSAMLGTSPKAKQSCPTRSSGVAGADNKLNVVELADNQA